ncbi:phage tail tape measure protein [Chachezhania sediminis]|uniref:phage tail tape measure protein n=1 Tax=Chachezhania sediminis TaxID=2599291 RepID=UPI00131D4D56|nr:phage tail tape measure protein [Chachezhania sediminis]
MATTMMGRMQAVLGLDTRNFERGLDRASGQTRGFSREVAAMARRVGTALAAGVAAIGGITVATVNAATEISRLSQVANATPETFQRWSAAASSVGIEQDKLADILKDVNDRVGDFLSTGGGPMADFFENIAPKVGVTADQFRRLSGPEALQLYVDSLQKAGVNQQQMTFYLEAMASDTTALIPLLKDGGAEMQRLGDSAEAVGAVLDGRAIAAMRDTKKAMSQIGVAMTGVRNQIAVAALPSLQAVADLLVQLTGQGGALSSMITVIMGNLDRLAAYAATAAVGFGSYLAGAFVATQIGAVGLAGALGLVRTALIRIGIGAVVVLAGELVLWLSRLVQSAGSVGAAMVLLKDLASEVWGRMKIGAEAAVSSIRAVLLDLKAVGLDVFAALIDGGVTFANRYVGVYRGAFNAIKELWSALPAVIGDLAYKAANMMVEAVGEMLNSVVDKINSFITKVNDKIPETLKARFGTFGVVGTVELGGIDNPFAGAAEEAARAAGEAFKDGFNTDTFSGPDTSGIAQLADDAERAADNARLASSTLGALATSPLDAWRRLRETITGSGDEMTDALEETRASVDQLESSFGTAGGAAKKTKEQVSELKTATEDWKGSMRDGLKGLVQGTKSLGDALGGVLTKLSDMVLDKSFDVLWNLGSFDGIAGGILAAFGIGSNANGTDNWRGGLTRLNERGGEIVDLPSGSRVYPNDLSKKMVEGRDSLEIDARVYVDQDGNWKAAVADIAGEVSGRQIAQQNYRLGRAQKL